MSFTAVILALIVAIPKFCREIRKWVELYHKLKK